jgi:hypothetical protein
VLSILKVSLFFDFHSSSGLITYRFLLRVVVCFELIDLQLVSAEHGLGLWKLSCECRCDDVLNLTTHDGKREVLQHEGSGLPALCRHLAQHSLVSRGLCID